VLLQRVDEATELEVRTAVLVVELHLEHEAPVVARREGREAERALEDALEDRDGGQRTGTREGRAER
jgi:hypothetical protein